MGIDMIKLSVLAKNVGACTRNTVYSHSELLVEKRRLGRREQGIPHHATDVELDQTWIKLSREGTRTVALTGLRKIRCPFHRTKELT